MFNRNQNRQQTYSGAQVTHWLSWLARGMQKHGQTIFLIENLQPSWLEEDRQRRLYVLGSTMSICLILGLFFALMNCYLSFIEFENFHENIALGALMFSGVVGVIFGFILGLCKGLIDWAWMTQAWLWRRVKRTSMTWQTVIHIILTGLIVLAISELAVRLFFEWIQNFAADDFPLIDLVVDYAENIDARAFANRLEIISSVGAVLLLSMRTARRSLANDIWPVESLSWSWAEAFKSGIPILSVTAVVFFVSAVIHSYLYWGTAFFPLLGIGLLTAVILALCSAMLWEFLCLHGRKSRKLLPNRMYRWFSTNIFKTSGLVFPYAIIFILIAEMPLMDEIGMPELGKKMWDYSIPHARDAFGWILGVGGISTIFRWAFFGLRRNIVEIKTQPNEGIRLSKRSAVLSGIVIGVIVGGGCFAFFVFTEILSKDINLQTNLHKVRLMAQIGVLIGLIGWLFATLWYGGLDVIQHYILRYLLYRNNYAPLNYARFLDYAANDLNFLQKVGGGYIFIHRYLLEHFAAMAEPGEAEQKTLNSTPSEILAKSVDARGS